MKKRKYIVGISTLIMVFLISFHSNAADEISELNSQPETEKITDVMESEEIQVESQDTESPDTLPETESIQETQSEMETKEEPQTNHLSEKATTVTQENTKQSDSSEDKQQRQTEVKNNSKVKLSYKISGVEQNIFCDSLSEALRQIENITDCDANAYGESTEGDGRDISIMFLQNTSIAANEGVLSISDASLLGYQGRSKSILLTAKDGISVDIEAGTLNLGQNTTFENIRLIWSATSSKIVNNSYFQGSSKEPYGTRLIANGNRLHIGTGVENGGAYPLKIIGGSDAANLVNSNSNIWIESGLYEVVYGGSWNGKFSGTSTIKLTGDASVTKNIYGGSFNTFNNYAGNVFNGDSYISIAENAKVEGSVFGGGAFSNVEVGWEGSQTHDVLEFNGNTYLELGDAATIGGTIYGGGTNGRMIGSSYITIAGGSIAESLYGGNKSGYFTGNTNIAITGGKVEGNIYGGIAAGNNYSTLDGSTSVVIAGTVAGNVYGGSNDCYSIEKSTRVYILPGANIGKSVFAGGQMPTCRIKGDGTIFLLGGNLSGELGGETNISNNQQVMGKKCIYISGVGSTNKYCSVAGIWNFDELQIGYSPKASYEWYDPVTRTVEHKAIEECRQAAMLKVGAQGLEYKTSVFKEKEIHAGNMILQNGSHIWLDEKDGRVGSLTNEKGSNEILFTKIEAASSKSPFLLVVDNRKNVTGNFINNGDKLQLNVVHSDKITGKVENSGSETNLLLKYNNKSVQDLNNYTWIGKGSTVIDGFTLPMMGLDKKSAQSGMISLTAFPMNLKVAAQSGKQYKKVTNESVVITQNSSLTVEADISYLYSNDTFASELYQNLQTSMELLDSSGKVQKWPLGCSIIIYDSFTKSYYYYQTTVSGESEQTALRISDCTKMGMLDDKTENKAIEESKLQMLAKSQTSDSQVKSDQRSLRFIVNFEACEQMNLPVGEYKIKIKVEDQISMENTKMLVSETISFMIMPKRSFSFFGEQSRVEENVVSIPCEIQIGSVGGVTRDTLYEARSLGLYCEVKDSQGNLIVLPEGAYISFIPEKDASSIKAVQMRPQYMIIKMDDYPISGTQNLKGVLKIGGLKAGSYSATTILSATSDKDYPRMGKSIAEGIKLAELKSEFVVDDDKEYDILVELDAEQNEQSRIINEKEGGGVQLKIAYRAPIEGNIFVYLQKRIGKFEYENLTQEISYFVAEGKPFTQMMTLDNIICNGQLQERKNWQIQIVKGTPTGTYRLLFVVVNTKGEKMAEMPYNIVVK